MERLIGFGASSVEGACDSQGGFFKRLGQKLAAAGKPHECLNHGVGGDTTRNMLARLAQVRPHLPAKVIVLLGSNDFPRDVDWAPESRVPLEEFRRNVDTILDELGSPTAIFITSFAVCPPRTGIMPPTFQSYMDQALKSASAHHLRIWDLHAESLKWDDRYLAEDGLHYNDAGHEMIAQHLLTML